MDLPKITATEQTVIPATETKVFDKWWLKNLQVNCPTETEGRVRAVLVKYRDLADGTKDFSNEQVTIVIPNLWEKASESETLSNVMGAILLEVQSLATEQGKI